MQSKACRRHWNHPESRRPRKLLPTAGKSWAIWSHAPSSRRRLRIPTDTQQKGLENTTKVFKQQVFAECDRRLHVNTKLRAPSRSDNNRNRWPVQTIRDWGQARAATNGATIQAILLQHDREEIRLLEAICERRQSWSIWSHSLLRTRNQSKDFAVEWSDHSVQPGCHFKLDIFPENYVPLLAAEAFDWPSLWVYPQIPQSNKQQWRSVRTSRLHAGAHAEIPVCKERQCRVWRADTRTLEQDQTGALKEKRCHIWRSRARHIEHARSN